MKGAVKTKRSACSVHLAQLFAQKDGLSASGMTYRSAYVHTGAALVPITAK